MDTKLIGGKIAQARKRINISQTQLAQLLFISPQAVGKWERGESIPDIITFSKLAEILGVDLNYFSENFPSTTTDLEQATDNENNSIDDTALSRKERPAYTPSSEQTLLTNFSGSDLVKTDFASVTAHGRKFNGSALSNSDFSGADLTGSSFIGSDVRGTNFDGANLTDCIMEANDLTDASFNKATLVRTRLNKSSLNGVKFIDATLADVSLCKTDLRKTIFENCVFDGVDFDYSDLSGVCLDGQTFINVKFHNGALTDATFNGATLKNVSFRSTFALTNKYYRDIKTIRFAGARMDKLTYAALKSIGANLSEVTVF
jgi:uncharacterized protein YjbI with pentapeptide repeats